MESLEQQIAAGLTVQLIPNRLYFTSMGSEPQDTEEMTFVGVPLEMAYVPFFADFGPLNLGHVVAYCRLVCEALAKASCDAFKHTGTRPATKGGSPMVKSPDLPQVIGRRGSEIVASPSSQPLYRKVVLYCPHKAYERANAACLAGCFCVSVLQYSPEYTNRLFSRLYPHFLAFRDASYGVANFNLYQVDCWAGYKKAWDMGWVTMEPWVEKMGDERKRATTSDVPSPINSLNSLPGRINSRVVNTQFASLMHPDDPLLPLLTNNAHPLYTFDSDAYHFYERIENGDWNWIVPGQIMAFSGPLDSNPLRPAIGYVPMFRDQRVLMVIRLNEKDCYNELAFTNQGIQHLDCNFADGSVPCDAIVERFLAHVTPVLQRTNAVGDLKLNAQKAQATKRFEETMNSRPTTAATVQSISSRGTSSRPASSLRTSSAIPLSREVKIARQASLGGAVAIHCKAGLGRTGTLIAIYLILHYNFTARECIGWLRICRPGSILGEQQAFLEQFESRAARAREQNDMSRTTRFLGDGTGPAQAVRGAPSPTKSPLAKSSILKQPSKAMSGLRAALGGSERAHTDSAAPLSMRSATPTTATTVSMLKSLTSLGDAKLQRLPLVKSAAMSRAAADTLPNLIPSSLSSTTQGTPTFMKHETVITQAQQRNHTTFGPVSAVWNSDALSSKTRRTPAPSLQDWNVSRTKPSYVSL